MLLGEDHVLALGLVVGLDDLGAVGRRGRHWYLSSFARFGRRRAALEVAWTVALPTFHGVGYLPWPMDYELVNYEVADGVATVTLNNPEKRNMLSGQMLAELVDAMRTARDSEDARAVVLTGAGDKAFCAGADLGGFAADAPLVAKHFASDLFLEFFRLMPRLGKPSLCAVNGHVLAGGMGLALSCDLVIAKEGATFGTPEINVGAFPYMIMAIIYRNVPRKKVNEMMLLGERLSAEQAVEFGLANKVVPAAEFDAAVADWAGKLASKSPVLMRLGHDAMYRQQDMAVDDALEFLRTQLSLTFSTEDIVEGVTAFFEKREPQWKGR